MLLAFSLFALRVRLLVLAVRQSFFRTQTQAVRLRKYAHTLT